MKIRNGFVSNSSSSSFVIIKRNLSNEQIEMIKNHYSIAKQLAEQNTSINYMYNYEDAWTINETDLTIEGSTNMNNFDMYDFLEKFVQVNLKLVRWDD